MRRRGEAQCYPKYPGSSECDTVQEEGIPDAFADELANRPVIGERITEVAAHQVAFDFFRVGLVFCQPETVR